MRVLWLIDSLGPGGAESLMPALLKELQAQGIEPAVCFFQARAGNPIAGKLEELGIRVDPVLVRNMRNPFDLGRIMRYIRQCRPDIVHTQLETADALGTLAASLLGIPSVSTVHTLELPSRRFRKFWRNLVRWTVLKFLSKRVIVVSEVARRHYLKLGFNDSKLLTIYNGIEPGNFGFEQGDRPGKAAVFGVPDDSLVITSVAVLREAKGIQYMLRALPELVARFPRLRYVIVGDGNYRPDLEELSKALGMSEHVVFMQYRNNIPEILAASDLFVYPTLNDALPTALLEAMAARLPIAASCVGGVPEILQNELTGLLVPPADHAELAHACLRLLLDPALAQRLASDACKSVRERFDVRRQAAQLINLYRQVGAPHEL